MFASAHDSSHAGNHPSAEEHDLEEEMRKRWFLDQHAESEITRIQQLMKEQHDTLKPYQTILLNAYINMDPGHRHSVKQVHAAHVDVSFYSDARVTSQTCYSRTSWSRNLKAEGPNLRGVTVSQVRGYWEALKLLHGSDIEAFAGDEHAFRRPLRSVLTMLLKSLIGQEKLKRPTLTNKDALARLLGKRVIRCGITVCT